MFFFSAFKNITPLKMHILRPLTYLLTPWSTVLLEQLTGSQLVKKFSVFCSIQNFEVPATCLYPEPDQSSPYTQIPLPEDHLNVIIPSTPGSSKWFFSLIFPHKNPYYTSPLPHMCYMPIPFHSPRFGHPKNTG